MVQRISKAGVLELRTQVTTGALHNVRIHLCFVASLACFRLIRVFGVRPGCAVFGISARLVALVVAAIGDSDSLFAYFTRSQPFNTSPLLDAPTLECFEHGRRTR
jgi:hypothetical protein